MVMNRNRLENAFGASEGTPDIDDGLLLTQYLRARDQAAFEMLVHRHGSMILGTCQRILRNQVDAEDAFQAVFLVLLQKAGGLTQRKTIGDWLYGVAYHTALKARSLIIKRRKKEGAVDPPKNDKAHVESLREVLDQELVNLPAKFREAIVLCDLDNIPRKDAANRMGIPEGTLSSRLTTARKMLGERLSKKGIVLGGVALATLGGAVPSSLLASTVRNANIFTGEAVGSISQSILEKAQLGSRVDPASMLAAFAPYLLSALGGGSLAFLVGLLYFWPPEKGAKTVDPTLFEWSSKAVDFSGNRFTHYGMGKGRKIVIQESEVLMEFGKEAGTGHLGLWSNQELAGNFEIEINYEILDAPEKVMSGYGVSLGVLVDLGKPWGAVNAQRGIYPSLGDHQGAGRHIPSGAENHYTRETIPALTRTGRLVVRRNGEQMIVSGGGPAPLFPREIKRFHCPTVPTKGIAIYADPGGSAQEFQCRIFGVQLTGNLPD